MEEQEVEKNILFFVFSSSDIISSPCHTEVASWLIEVSFSQSCVIKVSIVTVLLEFEFHLNFPHDIATLLIQILLSLTAIIVLILPPLQTILVTDHGNIVRLKKISSFPSKCFLENARLSQFRSREHHFVTYSRCILVYKSVELVCR